MVYDIACKNCDYKTTWNCTWADYEKQLQEKCPKCNHKKLYQDYTTRTSLNFELVGYGWTRKLGSLRTQGTNHQLDEALRENDYLKKRSEKDGGISDRVAHGYKEDHNGNQ